MLAVLAGLLCTVLVFESSSQASDRPQALFFGDSLFAGTGVAPKRPVLPTDTSRLLRWQPTVDAFGGTGFTTGGKHGKPYLDRLKHDRYLQRRHYDVIVLEGGTNDALYGDLPAMASRIAEVVGYLRAQQPRARLVLVGGFTPHGHEGPRFDEADAILEKAAADLRLLYVSQFGYHRLDRGFLGKDHFHPNRAGYRLMARDLATHLRTPAPRLPG